MNLAQKQISLSRAASTGQKEAIPRREFLRLGTAGAAAAIAVPALTTTPAIAAEPSARPVSESGGCCLTKSSDFYNVERGDPLPYKLPLEKRREIGMERETWRLEVIADPDSNAKIEQPLLKSNGTALTFDALMKLAATKATSFLKVITCNNLTDPLGHGLWEGVPLRDVLWLAGPVENLRYVYYYGHHNEDPKQMFKCYVPMNRVFEEPPGELPVLKRGCASGSTAMLRPAYRVSPRCNIACAGKANRCPRMIPTSRRCHGATLASLASMPLQSRVSAKVDCTRPSSIRRPSARGSGRCASRSAVGLPSCRNFRRVIMNSAAEPSTSPATRNRCPVRSPSRAGT